MPLSDLLTDPQITDQLSPLISLLQQISTASPSGLTLLGLVIGLFLLRIVLRFANTVITTLLLVIIIGLVLFLLTQGDLSTWLNQTNTAEMP